MKIVGLQKTTLLDYPGRVAATVFLAGCNFCCPFCHNMNLVTMDANNCEVETNIKVSGIDEYSEEDIFIFLKKRQGILDGVCITGGEPTLNRDLPELIKKIKELGYLVKLDTNGTNPEMLKYLIENKLIDYVAMDIKSSMKNYGIVSGITDNKDVDKILNNIKESIEFLLEQDSFDYEFRTTVIKEYHDEACFKDISEMISGAKAYYLQNFVDSEYVKDHSLTSYSYDELNTFRELLIYNIKKVEIRGIDE